MLLAGLAETSAQVGAASARSTKIGLLADLLTRLDAQEIEPAVAFLTGETRQGRIGVGWATIRDLDVAPAESPTLTVLELDDALAELVNLTGPGSSSARRLRLTKLFECTTEPEAELARRLLRGELRQGALGGLMADAIAKAACVRAAAVRRAAMFSGDLAGVAAIAMAEGEDGLGKVRLQVLRPVLPMLASTATNVGAAVEACGRSSVEWKLDGVRVQVHRNGDAVRIFTRNLNEITERLAGVADLVRSLPASSLVLDGEVIGGALDERPELFQSTMSRLSRHERDDALPDLHAWFFDCLHLDGRDLVDEPLLTRLDALQHVAAAWCIPGTVTDDPAVAATVLDAAISSGHEGVMVKAAGSPYEAGRRGKSWRKVKPVRTLDLVVLGAEWGHGRRRGWLSNLHLGARATDGDGFVMVGKTFKGLTDELLTWQTERLQELAVEERGIGVFAAPRAGRGGRRRRRAGLAPLRRWRHPPLRTSSSLPPGQVAGRGRLHRHRARAAATRTVNGPGATGSMRSQRGLWRSLVSALDWGSRGREFKSPQPDGEGAGVGSSMAGSCVASIVEKLPVRLREVFLALGLIATLAFGAGACSPYDTSPGAPLAGDKPTRAPFVHHKPGHTSWSRTFVDTSRQTVPSTGPALPSRTLMTAIYRPNGHGRFPLIVFSHGYVGHPDKFTKLFSAWADAGFVVAAPAFPLTNNRAANPKLADVEQQPADVSFVLDNVLVLNQKRGSHLYHAIDTHRIGASGLSLGGATTYALVYSECCRDQRITAAAVLDGFQPGVPLDGHVPLLIAHSDTDPVIAYTSARESFAAASPPAWLVTLHGASHVSEWEDDVTLYDHIAEQITTDFWDATLNRKEGSFTRLERDATVPGLSSIEVKR